MARRRRARPLRATPVVLVTGFEPFGGDTVNPSWEICQRLPDRIGGTDIARVRVPCVFGRAIDVVVRAIEELGPSLVIALGLAGGAAQILVERVAINVEDAHIPDNDGVRPVDRAVAADGPAAHLVTVPIKTMVAAIRAAGVPSGVSDSAGTYVCNHLLYGVLDHLARRRAGTRAGFMHVPYAGDGQAAGKVPTLKLADMVRGVEAAIAAALDHPSAGGAVT